MIHNWTIIIHIQIFQNTYIDIKIYLYIFCNFSVTEDLLNGGISKWTV